MFTSYFNYKTVPGRT